MKRHMVWGIILLGILLTGCFAEQEQVMVEPRADLRGAERVAMLYLENHSLDPGIAFDLEQGIGKKLSEYYHVIDSSRVESAVNRYDLRRGTTLTIDLIQDIGDMLLADVIVVGEVTYYFEDVNMGIPYITSTYDAGTKARWSAKQDTTVLVTMNARVISTRNGAILYSKRSEGRYVYSSFRSIPHSGLDAPPRSLVPHPSRQDIPYARRRAVENAVESFTADLLPTYVWRRVE